MNLLFPLNKPALPRPVFTLTDTLNTDKPNLLVICDSYFTQLRISPFVKAFNHWDCWVYNRDINSSRPYYNEKHLNMIFDAAEVIEDADIVMAVFTAPMLYNYMFGFPETVFNLFAHGQYCDEEKVEKMMQTIRNVPGWYDAVVKQAKECGLTTEENLRRNAIYVIQSNENKKP